MSKAVKSILDDYDYKGGLSMTNETMSLDNFTSFTGGRKEIASMSGTSTNVLTRKMGTDFTAIGR